MKCIVRPAIFDVVHWTGDNYDEIKKFCGEKAFLCMGCYNEIHVLYDYSQTWQHCLKNDYIVKTNSGYFRVVKNNDFDRIYEIIN